MKPIKCVVARGRFGKIGLEKIGNGLVKLEEVRGKIIFSETKPTGYGSCLNLKLNNCKQMIWWQDQKKIPLPALVGQILRGFYIDTSNSNKIICLEAYELQNMEGKVLNRACRSRIYKFIEAD